jgi:hypothetical protein
MYYIFLIPTEIKIARNFIVLGHVVARLIEALRWRSEGRGFGS